MEEPPEAMDQKGFKAIGLLARRNSMVTQC